MAGKTIDVYQGIKTVHSCRLYHYDFRKLFRLPRIKGKIVSAELIGGIVCIGFEIERQRYIKHKLGGK